MEAYVKLPFLTLFLTFLLTLWCQNSKLWCFAQDIGQLDYDYKFEPAPYRSQIFSPGGRSKPSTFGYCALLGKRAQSSQNDNNAEDKTPYMTIPELIVHHGHKYEEHYVVTDDGYNLTLFRILKDGIKAEFEPVFFQHGFLGTGADWLMTDTVAVYVNSTTLPYTLVRFNFDVWLGNSRGNEWSNRHVRFSEYDPRYWSFSFHEMGAYDLPKVYEYILGVTKWNRLNYIGHSMGTTMFYISMMERPEFNDKINVMVALAPSGSLNNTKSPARLLSNITELTKYLPLEGKLPPQLVLDVFRKAVPEQCVRQYVDVFNPCESIIALLIGTNSDNFNGTTYRRVTGHLPSSTSIRTLMHYLQTIQYRNFRQYDFGPLVNLKRYGSVQPPAYNLSLVNVETLNFYGKYDTLVVAEDVNTTLSGFSKQKEMANYELLVYNHLDFVWGDDAAPCVNLQIVRKLLRKVNCTAAADPVACQKALNEAF